MDLQIYIILRDFSIYQPGARKYSNTKLNLCDIDKQIYRHQEEAIFLIFTNSIRTIKALKMQILPRTGNTSASKSSIRRFVIMEKAPTRAFFWLKAATTTFTFKTLS